jgi:hypothetical protein
VWSTFLQAAGAEGTCRSGDWRFVRAGNVSEYETATLNFNMIFVRRPLRKTATSKKHVQLQ